MRACPTESIRANRSCAAAIRAGSMPSSSRAACAHASSAVVPHDHVHPQPEPQRAAVLGGPGAHPVDPLGDRGRRLAPHQVHVGARRAATASAAGDAPPK